MRIQSAIRCFDENIKLFGNPQVEPEKFNLYAGLAEMARAIERLDAEVYTIEQVVERVVQRHTR